MKKIIISALFVVISMAVCATSFVINDLQNINNWYTNNILPIQQERMQLKQEMKRYKLERDNYSYQEKFHTYKEKADR